MRVDCTSNSSRRSLNGWLQITWETSERQKFCSCLQDSAVANHEAGDSVDYISGAGTGHLQTNTPFQPCSKALDVVSYPQHAHRWHLRVEGLQYSFELLGDVFSGLLCLFYIKILQ